MLNLAGNGVSQREHYSNSVPTDPRFASPLIPDSIKDSPHPQPFPAGEEGRQTAVLPPQPFTGQGGGVK